MELHEWLDKPENVGKAAWLAEQLKRSKAAVSLWRSEGVPMLLMRQVAELTGNAVSLQCMLNHALACKTAKPKPAARKHLPHELIGQAPTSTETQHAA